MKRFINVFGRILCAFILCAGVVFTGCVEGPLDEGGNTEQGGSEDNDGNGSDNGGYEEGESKDIITNASGGVTLTVSLRNITEVGVAFYGEAVLAENYTADSFGVLYSEKEVFAAADAVKIPIVDIYGINYSVSTSSLKPATTYYYTLYIKQGDLYKYGEIKSFITGPLFAPELNAASEVTEVSSIISGTLRVASGIANDLEYGFQYCAAEDFLTDVVSRKITDVDSENKFCMPIRSLVPMTIYYYRSYVKMNGVYGYSDVKSFTTASLVAPELNAASEVTYTSATLSGTKPVFSEALLDWKNVDFEFGVLVSKQSRFPNSESLKYLCYKNHPQGNGDSGGPLDILVRDGDDFRVTVSNLEAGITYYYASYICANGKTVYGETKSFTTKCVNFVIPIGATELSSNETANCYIVSQAGQFCYKTCKGNGTGCLVPSSVEILWESFGTSTVPIEGDLIKSAYYSDGYIAFQTADIFKEGNAVIAARDASGNILWSWHIWLTDKPEEQVYYNNAGTMMDRNLGATSANPGDVGALGLLYQWGRKDPFLSSSSISSSTIAKSTITWPSAVSSNSSCGTIEYAIANPTTFILDNDYNNDWYYTGSSSTDNTRWTTCANPKSIYDPCPAGWRIPDGGDNGVWSSAIGSSSYYYDKYDNSHKGMNFFDKLGSASIIWYPASGVRSSFDGNLDGVGYVGYYKSTCLYGSSTQGLKFEFSGIVFPSQDIGRAAGDSVRCIKESK